MLDDAVDTSVLPGELAKWDPSVIRVLTNAFWPAIKAYFRAEVRGLCLAFPPYPTLAGT